MQLSKKIGQFRQWTGEKIGNAQRTERGEEFSRYESDTNMRSEQTTLVHEAFINHLRSLGKRKEDEKPKKLPIEQLGSAMAMYGTQLPEDSEYGQTLKQVGEAHERIASFQQDYLAVAQSGYGNRLNLILQDMKEFFALKKKMENRRLDFDAKQNRLQKSKKENHEMLEETNYARAKYEESLNDVTQRMVRLNENDEDQLQDLLAFVDHEVALYQKSLKVLLNLQSDLSSIPRSSVRQNSTSRQEDFTERSSFRDDPPPSRMDGPEKKLIYAAQTGSLVYPAQGPNGLQAPPNPRSHNGTATPPPYTPGNSSGILKQVKVIFDFDGESDEELTIRKGDIINVTYEIDKGWWEGEIADGSGRCGMFPNNYCEVISKPAPFVPTRPTVQEPDHEPVSRGNSFHRPSSFSSNGSRNSTNAPPAIVPSPASRQSISVNSRSTISGPLNGPSPLTKKQNSMSMAAPPIGRSESSYSACSSCDCTNFVPHAFRPGQCNECYHKH